MKNGRPNWEAEEFSIAPLLRRGSNTNTRTHRPEERWLGSPGGLLWAAVPAGLLLGLVHCDLEESCLASYGVVHSGHGSFAD